MSETEIQLTGWKAVVAIIIVLAVAAHGMIARNTSLDTEAKEVIRQWLVAEFAGEVLSKYEGTNYLENREFAGTTATEILSATKVTITSIKAKGSKNEPIVRVTVLVDGKPPADGKSVRYYRMNYSTLTGWTMGHETWALSYHLKFF